MISSMVAWSAVRAAELLPKRYLTEVRVRNGVRLGDLCDVSSGLYVAEYVPESTRGAVPYIRVNNVREFVPNLSPGDVEYVVPQREWGERVTVRPGDVVIARTGTLGRAFVVPARLSGAVMSQHVTRLRLSEASEVRAQLLAAYLNSPRGKQQVEALASGSTRLELTHDDILAMPVPRPGSAPEPVAAAARSISKEFAAVLSGAEGALRAVAELVDVPPIPEEKRFSVPFDREQMVRSLAPRRFFPPFAVVEQELLARFRCMTLGDIATVVRGAGTLAAEYESHGVPYIRTSSIVNFGVELFPEHYGSDATYRAHGQNVGSGDVLLSMEGKIGVVALLGDGERCLVKNHIEIIRLLPRAPVGPEFLYALLSCAIGQRQLERRTVVQTTIPGLGSESRTLLIPVGAEDGAQRERLSVAQDTARAKVQASTRARIRLRSACSALLEYVARA